jgi:chromate transporter
MKKTDHKENLKLFLSFLKIGATTFGGGYAMISQIKEEIVDRRKWITDDELVEVTAIAESTPGPMAINLATFVGYKKGGFLGSVLATIGVVLPSLIVIYLISLFFNAFIRNVWVAYAFVGIKCAVAFLIIQAAYSLIKEMRRDIYQIAMLVVITVIMLLFEFFSVSFSAIYLILIGGALGLIIYSITDYLAKKKAVKNDLGSRNEEEKK